MKGQQSRAITGRPLGKDCDRPARIQHRLDTLVQLVHGVTTTPLDEKRARTANQTSDQRPGGNLDFRHKMGRSVSQNHENIQPADMIANDQRGRLARLWSARVGCDKRAVLGSPARLDDVQTHPTNPEQRPRPDRDDPVASGKADPGKDGRYGHQAGQKKQHHGRQAPEQAKHAQRHLRRVDGR
jgi:hypothetical protein